MLPQRYQVGVVGFGVAGGALACLLGWAGHAVTIFEQAPTVGPVGTGLLLQPSGQGVLARLGLLDGIAAQSEPVHELNAFQPDGRTLIHLRYDEIAPGCRAYGVHRGTLSGRNCAREDSSAQSISAATFTAVRRSTSA